MEWDGRVVLRPAWALAIPTGLNVSIAPWLPAAAAAGACGWRALAQPGGAGPTSGSRSIAHPAHAAGAWLSSRGAWITWRGSMLRQPHRLSVVSSRATVFPARLGPVRITSDPSGTPAAISLRMLLRLPRSTACGRAAFDVAHPNPRGTAPGQGVSALNHPRSLGVKTQTAILQRSASITSTPGRSEPSTPCFQLAM